MLLKVFLLIVSATLCLAGSPRSIRKIRPCALDNCKCIGENLAANSRCNLNTRPVRHQLRLASHRFETPHFNSSCIDNNLIITGLDRCFVSEFYYNMKSNAGVLGIDCPRLNFASDRTYLQHYPLEEDSVYHYRINGTYPLIRLTTTLYKKHLLNMCKEFTFAYVKQLPTFHIDPKDKPTEDFLTKDLSFLSIFERETFLYRASLLARHFVNRWLCDFGCD